MSLTRIAVINDLRGLHARNAARIAAASRESGLRCTLRYGDRSADSTSLVEILALQVPVGAQVRVTCDGPEAARLLGNVVRLLTDAADNMPDAIARSDVRGQAWVLGEERPVGPNLTQDQLEDTLRLLAARLRAVLTSSRSLAPGLCNLLNAQREILLHPATREALFADGDPNKTLASLLPTSDLAHDLVVMLRHNLGTLQPPNTSPPEHPTILVADDLAPLELVLCSQLANVVGLALATDLPSGHLALVAQSLGLPMQAGLGTDICGIQPGASVHLDPRSNCLTDTLSNTTYSARAFANGPDAPRPSTCALLANANSPTEIRSALANGSAGIGLLRSEPLYLGSAEPPTADTLYAAYLEMAQIAEGHPLAIRVADLGGLKMPYWIQLTPTESGLRGAPLLLRHPEWLDPALSALARLAQEHAFHLLFPGVTSAEQWQLLTQRWQATCGSHHHLATLGLFIETHQLLSELHHLDDPLPPVWLGTNDLLRSAAQTRTAVGELASDSLALLESAISIVHERGASVTVCGDMAGRLPHALVLRAMGADALSVTPLRLRVLQKALLAAPSWASERWLVRLQSTPSDAIAHVLHEWHRDVTQKLGHPPDGWPEMELP